MILDPKSNEHVALWSDEINSSFLNAKRIMAGLMKLSFLTSSIKYFSTLGLFFERENIISGTDISEKYCSIDFFNHVILRVLATNLRIFKA